MKIFNGRAATDEYMSTHTLTFSTPEMTLKKFALWLADQVNMQGNNEQVPRLMLFVKEFDKDRSNGAEFMPDVDDSFRPTGAIVDLYGKTTDDNPQIIPSPKEGPHPMSCTQCGHALKAESKFCSKCGTKQ